MFLSHCVLGAIEAIENQVTEKWKPDLAMAANVILAGMITEEKIDRLPAPADIEIFS